MSKALQLFKTWNYWFCKGVAKEGEKYQDCNIKIDYDIRTVQDFWLFYMELPKPSDLNETEHKQGFTLCRSGVRPEWENPELKTGGTWTYMVESKKAYAVNVPTHTHTHTSLPRFLPPPPPTHERLYAHTHCDTKHSDTFWKYLLMAAIGQRFTVAGEIDDDEIVAIQHEVHVTKSVAPYGVRIKVLHKRKEKSQAVKNRYGLVTGNSSSPTPLQHPPPPHTRAHDTGSRSC